MNRQVQLAKYQARIERVIDYIQDHLDEPLDLNHLAEIACFSPYHFHRVYRAVMQETVAETVRRLRLHRACGDLIANQLSIGDVASRAGYGSVEAFTRAFRKDYDMPPGEYRAKQIDQVHPLKPYSFLKDDDMYNVTIGDVPSVRMAAVAHKGSYMDIGKAFEKIYIWAMSNELTPGPETRSIGVYYDDPESVKESDLRSHAGFTISGDLDISKTQNAGDIDVVELKGGRAATLEHVGPYAELEQAYNWFYRTWLMEQNYELADLPPFEEYINDPKTTPPQELITKINVMLK